MLCVMSFIGITENERAFKKKKIGVMQKYIEHAFPRPAQISMIENFTCNWVENGPKKNESHPNSRHPFKRYSYKDA